MNVPSIYSRFANLPFVREVLGDDELMWRPYRTELYAFSDEVEPTIEVTASETDSLWSLAAKHFRGTSSDRPEELAWLIAEVNDIVDPTRNIAGLRLGIPPIGILDTV